MEPSGKPAPIQAILPMEPKDEMIAGCTSADIVVSRPYRRAVEYSAAKAKAHFQPAGRSGTSVTETGFTFSALGARFRVLDSLESSMVVGMFTARQQAVRMDSVSPQQEWDFLVIKTRQDGRNSNEKHQRQI